ncbi:hypothetical protein Scep_016830 [Stephania cephalantha]|uniref:Uncharacterized protein n=1 Tax=Stephania cephalantha TaxID=152367 RepID=A0AAP0INK5_9MAGN
MYSLGSRVRANRVYYLTLELRPLILEINANPSSINLGRYSEDVGPNFNGL